MVEKGSKHTALSKLMFDVDTLEPPNLTVAPVAPFVGDHDLAGDGTVDLCQVIESFGRITEQSNDARVNAVGFER